MVSGSGGAKRVPEEIEGTYFLYQIIKKRTILTNDSLFY